MDSQEFMNSPLDMESAFMEPTIPVDDIGKEVTDIDNKTSENQEVIKEKKSSKKIQQEIENSITKQKNVDYETTVRLPSNWVLYGDAIPAEISLRGMTTRDEKVLYASQGGNVFQKILSNCITEPKNLDLGKLISADELFLVLQLRMITYGPEYKVDVQCPHCGQTSTYTVMLNELDVNYLDDDFKEPIEVKLPRCGDTLQLKLLRNEDVEFIDKYSKKFAKQFNLPVREVEYTSRLAKYILAINGNKVDFGQARDYVENMMSRDSAEIRSVLAKIVVGVDTTCQLTCNSCGEDFKIALPMTSEFFRPTFE